METGCAWGVYKSIMVCDLVSLWDLIIPVGLCINGKDMALVKILGLKRVMYMPDLALIIFGKWIWVNICVLQRKKDEDALPEAGDKGHYFTLDLYFCKVPSEVMSALSPTNNVDISVSVGKVLVL